MVQSDEPLRFLETAIAQIRANPEDELTWDMFIDKGKLNTLAQFGEVHGKAASRQAAGIPVQVSEEREHVQREKPKNPKKERNKEKHHAQQQQAKPPPLVSSPLTANNHTESEMGRTQRAPSVMKAAEVAQIPHIPVILFIGGPGGGKTRHAARIANALGEQGLVHICMPDIIRSALTKYKDLYPEWKTANEHYLRGELIPNHLALALVKAEMGRHPEATAFFLEGYPREARQVEDFEKQVKSVNMALILDYDEKTLRDHMEKRGMGMEIIDQRIKEFKQKTLPSAKYFDDQRLLHLIPGEKDDQTIYERLKDLVLKAMSTGVPIYNTNPSSQPQSRANATPHQENGNASLRVDNPSPEVAATHHNEPPPVDTQARSVTQTPTSVSHHDTRVHTPAETPVIAESSTPPHPPEPEAINRSTTASKEPEGSPVEAAVSNRSVPSSAQRATVIPDIQKPSTPVTTKSATQSRDGIPSRDRAPLGLPTAAPVILVIGAPGSQKVDIAKRIAQKYEGFEIISMGALLRSNAAAQSNDELWQRIARKIEQGEPVPMKLCRELLYNELRRIGQTGWGYVIEGYPRTEAQLTDLQTMLGKIDLAILIDCTEQFCLSTITKRGEQKDADVRLDDKLDIAKRRMAVFKQNTLPMLKMLDEQGILRVVEGDSDPDTVFKDVSNIIDQNLFIRDDEGGNSLDDSKKDFTVE